MNVMSFIGVQGGNLAAAEACLQVYEGVAK